jgi:thymidylate kinase
MEKGLFIIFEGNNGAGKTTMINELLKNIQNTPIEKTKYHNKGIYNWNVYKFPNRTTILGKKIDNFLKKKIKFQSKEVELKFFADNRKEFQNEIEYILEQGYNVICDRYIYSSMAYTLTNQTMKILNNQEERLLSLDHIIQFDKNFLKPDFVFLIKGNYLHLRNETKELYHQNNKFNDLLLNNYIISLQHINTPFAIIDNVYGELNKSISIIINIIHDINKKKL